MVNDTTSTTTTQAPIPEPAPEQENETPAQQVLNEIETQPTISEEVAIQAATNPEVVASLSVEDAEKVFDAIDANSLSDEEAEQIVEAVQNAPLEVRQTFEQEINVFEGSFDTYVPVGSTVSVGVRRAIVAATAVLSTVGVATGASSSNSSRRNK